MRLFSRQQPFANHIFFFFFFFFLERIFSSYSLPLLFFFSLSLHFFFSFRFFFFFFFLFFIFFSFHFFSRSILFFFSIFFLLLLFFQSFFNAQFSQFQCSSFGPYRLLTALRKWDVEISDVRYLSHASCRRASSVVTTMEWSRSRSAAVTFIFTSSASLLSSGRSLYIPSPDIPALWFRRWCHPKNRRYKKCYRKWERKSICFTFTNLLH